jgi:predicted NUDIX family phosphoesterase
LIRKEREATNQLHKRITVWAGGHVRREDGRTGIGSITNSAIRELQEELRIYATLNSLTLLGAVYLSSGISTKKHIAFVYEWRADTDDVEIALCNAEFMEKSGTSLQGMFLPPETIAAETSELEDWSKEILGSLILAKSEHSKVAVV